MFNIFPTAYFPSIQYLSLFLKTKNPRIELFETYHKQTCRTRCNVMTANGLQTLTVPILKINGNHTLIKDIEISYKESWQNIHLRCLMSAYKKSPYFDYYFPEIENIFKNKYLTIIAINEIALKSIFKILKINKSFSYTEDYEKIKNENDYRLSLSKWDKDSTHYPPYYQVFEDRQPFVSNLSILDLIFNKGPETIEYFSSIK